MMSDKKMNIKLIQFSEGRFETPWEFAVKARAEKLAELGGVSPEGCYLAATKELLDHDVFFNKGELSRQHDRLTLAYSEKNPRYLSDGDEAQAVGRCLRMAEHFSAEQAMKRAGEQVANSEHPFIKLVESILKQKFGNDRTKYARAMDEAQAQDKELAKAYVTRTYPGQRELQELEREGGHGTGTTNPDYPKL